MSKIKFSFSLLLTIFLVGILSTAAFASSAYGLGVAADGTGGFNFSFTKISTDTATDFTVTAYSEDPITKGFTELKHYDLTGVDTSKVTQAFPKTDGFLVGTVYKFELKHTTGNDVVGVKFGVMTESHNLKMANIADDPSGLPYTKPDGTTGQIDVTGSGLSNSNHTGADSVKKPNQKTHGFYQNNTNSCAVCHQTHTGADGNLLMKNGVYNTCSACHDGTTGAYNSFAPVTSEDVTSIAGTFNVSYDAAHNGSVHEADGSLKVTAAPGGNSAAGSKFDSSFDCASCHNPHGGGSASENNLNEDPLGWGTVVYSSTPGTVLNNVFGKTVTTSKDNQYGKLFQNPTIYTPATIPTSKGAEYIFVLNTAGVTDPTTNFFYKRANVPASTPILQTYRWQKGGYVADYSLWLQEKGYPFKADTALYNDDWANLSLTSADNYNDSAKDITRATDVTVVWRDGFAYGAGVANVKSIQVSLGIDVETSPYVQTLYNEDFTKAYTDHGVNKTAVYIPDSGVEMSKYCASCHTDYLSATRNDTTGVYTTAHRHMTLADETNCLRCHFGHGSDAQIMSDANDNSYFTGPHAGDLSYYTDVNKSSALKRYTGMSVCYACHGQGEQFLGGPNNGTDPNTGAVTDKLILGQPGTRGAYGE